MEGREGFEAVERQIFGAEEGFHVGPGGIDTFASPIGAAVHGGIEDLHAVVAHADGIGIGECQAEFAAYGRVVLADGMEFAADVLAGRLDSGEQSADDVVFEGLVEHRASWQGSGFGVQSQLAGFRVRETGGSDCCGRYGITE